MVTSLQRQKFLFKNYGALGVRKRLKHSISYNCKHLNPITERYRFTPKLGTIMYNFPLKLRCVRIETLNKNDIRETQIAFDPIDYK